MKKVLLFLLVSLAAQPAFGMAPGEKSSLLTTFKNKTKQATQYVCSKEGLKDMAASYALGMGITAIHEFGHALAGKILYNNPIDITLGTLNSWAYPLIEIGGIKLSGFNPATGFARIFSRGNNPAHDLIISAAGPLFGIASSLLAYLLLKKSTDKLPIAKTVSLYGLFNHTLGAAGLAGMSTPGTDAYKIKQLLTK